MDYIDLELRRQALVLQGLLGGERSREELSETETASAAAPMDADGGAERLSIETLLEQTSIQRQQAALERLDRRRTRERAEAFAAISGSALQSAALSEETGAEIEIVEAAEGALAQRQWAARQLSDAVERDARRYDGGYPLY